MKVSILLQDDSGGVFRGEIVLTPDSVGKSTLLETLPNASVASPFPNALKDDFELPVRAFIKKYASGKSGPVKFTLLLAGMTKGVTSVTVAASDLQSEWNSLTALMGGKYNTAYPTRAKERGWIDSPKSGTFILLPGWTEIMEEDAR